MLEWIEENLNYVKLFGLAVACFIAGWTMNGSRLESKLNDMTAQYEAEKAEAKAQAEKAKAEAEKRIAESAEEYQKASSRSNSDITKLRQEAKNEARKNPMPDACRISAGRMSVITEAVGRANAD